MDPFTISTGCVGLLSGIAQLSVQIGTFVSAVRDARRDIDAVLRELSSLSLCLSTLRDDSANIDYPDGLRENLIAVLKNCDFVIKEMKALLEKLSNANLLKKIQWSVNGKDDMNKLRSSLESHKSALEIALDMTSLLLISAIKSDVANVKTDTSAIRDKTSLIPSIKQDTSQIERLIQEIGFLRLQLNDTSANDARTQHLQRFLDQSTSYAETVIDAIDDDNTSAHILADFRGHDAPGDNTSDYISAATVDTTASPADASVVIKEPTNIHRLSLDSERSFTFGLGKKQNSDLESRPEDIANRRFSLLPDAVSQKPFGECKDQVNETSAPQMSYRPQLSEWPPTDQQPAQDHQRDPTNDQQGQHRAYSNKSYSRPSQQSYSQPYQASNNVYGDAGAYAHEALQTQDQQSYSEAEYHRPEPQQHGLYRTPQPQSQLSVSPGDFGHNGTSSLRGYIPPSHKPLQGALTNNNRKFNDDYGNQNSDSGNSGAVKRVQDFFRRRGKARPDSDADSW